MMSGLGTVRSLAVSSPFQSDPKTPSAVPLLLMTVDIGDGRQDSITIYPEDSPTELARSFSVKQGLTRPVRKQLETLISRKKAAAIKFQANHRSEIRRSLTRPSLKQTSTMNRSLDHFLTGSLQTRSTVVSEKPVSGLSKTPRNYGEWMYLREQMKKEERRVVQQRIWSAREFRPIMRTSRSKPVSRPRSSSESTEDLLLQKGVATMDKIKSLRSKAMEEEMMECTFRPEVNLRSERLDRGTVGGAVRFERLYMDAYDKEMRQFDRFENATKTEFPFRPKTISSRKSPESQTAMVNRLLNSKKNFENVISKIKDELDATYTESTSHPAFKPITGRGPTAPKYERRGNVHDHLYSQRTHKQAVVQKLLDQEKDLMSIPQVFALPISEKMAESARKRKILKLFSRLDHDGDGLIDYETLDLQHIDSRTIELLGPVWSDLKASQHPMRPEEFRKRVETQIRMMSQEEKTYVLKAAEQEEQETELLPFAKVRCRQPMLSRTSEELASRRRGGQQGADIYTRRMVERTLSVERLRQLQDQKSAAELKECTFQPLLTTYRRFH